VRDPGSFRDPHSQVFVVGDETVFRGLTAEGLADWEALERSRLLPKWVETGRLIATERADAPVDSIDGHWAAVLRHERIPFVSYAYEWPFGMLKDAALLYLELQLDALEEGLILKDGSPYNIQWRGAAPVFIDIGSIERLVEGEPWAGYRQFCSLFLYPLMLQAWKGMDFQPWLRGRLEGIPPAEMRNLLSLRDRLRRGALTHVVLHARLERRYGDRTRDVRKELRAAGFGARLLKANAERLAKLVRRLAWSPRSSEWSGYSEARPYGSADAELKAAFVREAAAELRPRLVWDLGANDGVYSRIAAAHAEYVLAADSDHAVVERLYAALRAEGERRILPLVADVADPPPGLGWRGRERAPLETRGRPNLVLALALVHHLAITRNIPLADLVDWFGDVGGALVVEFVTPEDAMVQRLLAPKREGLHADYRRDVFERALAERFAIARTAELCEGRRILYLAHPR
jgi:hypothetical protein